MRYFQKYNIIKASKKRRADGITTDARRFPERTTKMNDALSLNITDLSLLLPPRPARSNKSTFGRVLAVCGSRGMSGAAYLCALAAYRTGCGLVEILTPEDNRAILQTLLPEAIVTAYDADSPDNKMIADAVERADAVAVGCGLGQSETAREVLETVLRSARVPLVADADALNILAAFPSLWELIKVPTVITPHIGEMSRLSGIPVSDILADVPGTAEKFVAVHDVTCVLKDHNSIICDRKSAYINQFGNNGMATGGAGDVLAGVIASLLAQSKDTRRDVTQLAALGVLIHSLAGDAAASELGKRSMLASDIIAHIPTVLKNY